jgi:hypothetical protein
VVRINRSEEEEEKILEGSTKLNYMNISILPVRYLYEKIAIILIIKTNIFQGRIYGRVRAHRVYDIPMEYTKK